MGKCPNHNNLAPMTLLGGVVFHPALKQAVRQTRGVPFHMPFRVEFGKNIYSPGITVEKLEVTWMLACLRSIGRRKLAGAV